MSVSHEWPENDSEIIKVNKERKRTMKKQYINPTMDVVAMKMQQSLMAGSLNATISGSQANSDALGRESDFDDWDD